MRFTFTEQTDPLLDGVVADWAEVQRIEKERGITITGGKVSFRRLANSEATWPNTHRVNCHRLRMFKFSIGYMIISHVIPKPEYQRMLDSIDYEVEQYYNNYEDMLSEMWYNTKL